MRDSYFLPRQRAPKAIDLVRVQHRAGPVLIVEQTRLRSALAAAV